MSRPIRDYWPDYYDTILDYIKLAETEDAELQLIESAINQLFDDQFVLTSGLDAVKRREQILGIQVDPSTESLDFRRKRIINRYSTKPPFTIRYLQGRLDFLVGESRAITSIDVQNFTLFVEVAIEDAALFKEVERTINTIKPANLIYNQQTALGDGIALEEHITRRELARQTRLGTTWRLGVTLYAVAGAEVILK